MFRQRTRKSLGAFYNIELAQKPYNTHEQRVLDSLKEREMSMTGYT